MKLYEKIEILGNAFSKGEVDALAEILNENCSYNSDYAHKRISSAKDIVDSMRQVYNAVQKSVENGENSTYDYKVIQLDSVLKEDIKLEDLNGKTFFDVHEKGLLLYQYGDKDPVAVVFIKVNPG